MLNDPFCSEALKPSFTFHGPKYSSAYIFLIGTECVIANSLRQPYWTVPSVHFLLLRIFYIHSCIYLMIWNSGLYLKLGLTFSEKLLRSHFIPESKMVDTGAIAVAEDLVNIKMVVLSEQAQRHSRYGREMEQQEQQKDHCRQRCLSSI
jgi:hypothetical protein